MVTVGDRAGSPCSRPGFRSLRHAGILLLGLHRRPDRQCGLCECADDERGCSANVNFDAFADTVEPTTDTAEAIERLRRAWKATLAKDGKLHE